MNFSSNCGNVAVSILNPDGTTLASASACNSVFNTPVTLPVTGTYTLVIGPQSGSQITGSVTVTLWLFSEQTGTVITSGTPVGINISVPGQSSVMTFGGTTGQLTSVQLTNMNFSSSCGNVAVSILNPDGTTLASASACNSVFNTPVTLPVTGTYTLVIGPQSGSQITGSVTVTLWLYSNLFGSITPNYPTAINISIPGQSESLTFVGLSGQQASVQLANVIFSANCGNVAVSILNPDGTALVSGNACGSLYQTPVTLPASGTCTLVIGSQSGSLITGFGSAILTLQ